MRRLPTLMLIGLLAACAPAAQPGSAPRASELAGRAPGAPKRCVPIRPNESLRIVAGGHGLAYGRGPTVWVSSLGSCALRPGDTLVTQPIGFFYCHGDLVRSFDSLTKTPGETCELGDFVPYRR